MLGNEPKASNEVGQVLQPKVMTASELEELNKEAQVSFTVGIGHRFESSYSTNVKKEFMVKMLSIRM